MRWSLILTVLAIFFYCYGWTFRPMGRIWVLLLSYTFLCAYLAMIIYVRESKRASGGARKERESIQRET